MSIFAKAYEDVTCEVVGIFQSSLHVGNVLFTDAFQRSEIMPLTRFLAVVFDTDSFVKATRTHFFNVE